MLGRLATWFDDRTGSRKLVAALLIEQIPGGARWRYVWGSCLAFVFAIQLITGVLLMTSYSAGDSTAKVWLGTFELAQTAGYDSVQLREVVDLVRQHREQLLRAWNEYFDPER